MNTLATYKEGDKYHLDCTDDFYTYVELSVTYDDGQHAWFVCSQGTSYRLTKKTGRVYKWNNGWDNVDGTLKTSDSYHAPVFSFSDSAGYKGTWSIVSDDDFLGD